MKLYFVSLDACFKYLFPVKQLLQNLVFCSTSLKFPKTQKKLFQLTFLSQCAQSRASSCFQCWGYRVESCSQNFTKEGLKHPKSNRRAQRAKIFEFYFCKCGYNRTNTVKNVMAIEASQNVLGNFIVFPHTKTFWEGHVPSSLPEMRSLCTIKLRF